MKTKRNEVTVSDAYRVEDLMTTLKTSKNVVYVDRAFCVLVSLNSYELAGDRKLVVDQLAAALKRLGDRATRRMLRIYVAHVGRKVVHPSILRLLEEKDREFLQGEVVTSEPVTAAPADIEVVVPAPAAKQPKTTGKKARIAAASGKPVKKASARSKTRMKLGDPASEEPMRQCCLKGFGADKPAFIAAATS